MTKKQFGIIFTLMALIVCVGVLSMKLNQNGLTDPTDLSQVLSQNENDTLSTQDYFYKLRSDKEQADAKYLSDLKAVIADANTAQEQKDIANNSVIQKAELQAQEERVEVGIRNKGYEDALCMIDNNRVKVYVKVNDNLPEEDSAMIQQLVYEVTNLIDIEIESKK